VIEFEGDRYRQAELAKMKRRATGLFWLVTAIFIGASMLVGQYGWLSYVQATAEAAMVGALADWFAVTALFRHPLGLKIPHTAIIPHRKDSIAANFGQFVQSNFLTETVIAERVRAMDPARQAAAWLGRPENSRHLADHAAAGLTAVVQVVNDEDILTVIEQGVEDRIRATQFAPMLAKTLPLVVAGSRHQELLYGSLKLVTLVVEENEADIQAKISQETPWWLPRAVDQAIYRKIVAMLEETVEEVRTDPEHPLQAKFIDLINQFVENLENSPDVLAQEEALKEEFLKHPAVREFSSSLWQDLKTALLEYGTNPDSNLRPPIQAGLARFGQALGQDRAMLDKINGWLEEIVRYLVRVYGHEAGQLISMTIRNWDAEATSRKVELHIGRDLQFIRINGTIVGGLVGLGIHVVGQLL
jgi:uncharacterized membrane-anchored protein YjiN (DUF445 family)